MAKRKDSRWQSGLRKWNEARVNSIYHDHHEGFFLFFLVKLKNISSLLGRKNKSQHQGSVIVVRNEKLNLGMSNRKSKTDVKLSKVNKQVTLSKGNLVRSISQGPENDVGEFLEK